MNRSQHLMTVAIAVLSLALPAAAAAQPMSSPAATDRPDELALARSIVEVAFPPERREQMVETLMRTITAQMRESMPFGKVQDAGLQRIYDDYMSSIPQVLRPTTNAFLPRQMDALAQAYTRLFSMKELTDIAAFAQSSSGKAYLERSTEVLSDPAIAAVNTQYFAEAQGVTRKVVGELVEKVSAYLKEHPTVAEQMTGNPGDAADE